MADPRFHVKPCPTQYAGKYAAKVGSETGKSRDFFDAVGKVGDLEILNSGSTGKIVDGLRVLSKTSDTIRTGCGALPTSIGGVFGEVFDAVGSTAENGINWVLGAVGIDTTMVDAVRAFNPSVANQAYGQAKSLYEKIKNGSFDFKDIPQYLQDFQNLERLSRNIYTPDSGGEGQKITARCAASPYAMDLIARHGKYQFLFVVEFVFTDPFGELSDLAFPFVVKRSTRPNVKYHMDDVNYYNFRTKVITKSEFEDMSMSFHDDQLNEAMRFYNAYLRAHTPISNIASPLEMIDAEERGMDYVNAVAGANGFGSMRGTTGNIIPNYYTASFGPLAGGAKTVLGYINLYHVYDYGQSMNIFTFHRPKISQLSLNDVDMSGSDLNEFSCTFNYDALYIQTDVELSNENSPMIEQARANPFFPLRYNDSARSVQPPQARGYNPGTVPSTIADRCSPELNTSIVGGTESIVQSVNRSVKKSISSAVSDAFGKVSGKLFW